MRAACAVILQQTVKVRRVNQVTDDRHSATRSRYWQANTDRKRLKAKVIWKPYHRFIEQLVDLRGKRVLDFGSGIESPIIARFLRANGNLNGYHAYDIDAEALQKWQRQGKFYDFYGDDTGLESFDIVYADNTYEHLSLPQREEFLLRARRLLRQGGHLVLIYPHIANLNIIEHFERDRTHLLVSREHEAGFISSLGFSCDIYIAGLTFPYKPLLFSIKQFLRNVLLGYHPQTMVVIEARRVG